jgi:hypothetical protein
MDRLYRERLQQGIRQTTLRQMDDFERHNGLRMKLHKPVSEQSLNVDDDDYEVPHVLDINDPVALICSSLPPQCPIGFSYSEEIFRSTNGPPKAKPPAAGKEHGPLRPSARLDPDDPSVTQYSESTRGTMAKDKPWQRRPHSAPPTRIRSTRGQELRNQAVEARKNYSDAVYEDLEDTMQPQRVENDHARQRREEVLARHREEQLRILHDRKEKHRQDAIRIGEPHAMAVQFGQEVVEDVSVTEMPVDDMGTLGLAASRSRPSSASTQANVPVIRARPLSAHTGSSAQQARTRPQSAGTCGSRPGTSASRPQSASMYNARPASAQLLHDVAHNTRPNEVVAAEVAMDLKLFEFDLNEAEAGKRKRMSYHFARRFPNVCNSSVVRM